MLRRLGVRTVFGYPGGAILPVYDAIYESPHFQFILPRHEQGGGHMAEGYARATGEVGVVLVTSGPGATNVVTAMQDALSDGTPMVVLCGQVPTTAVGTDAFQEADVVGISRSCTKWNVMVKDISELPRRINEAFYIATQGRPGPVLVDLPKDVTAATLRKPIAGGIDVAIPQIRPLTPAPQHSSAFSAVVQRSAQLINSAKRPIIYAGQGILSTPEGPKLLREFAERANIPVTTTLQGLGGFDELHPLSLHMLGMHGAAYANLAMQTADLIIAMGARFDDRVTGNLKKFAPAAKAAAKEGRGGIIHFEIMPKNINKVVIATEAIEGDVVTNLGIMLPLVKRAERTEWFDMLAQWKTKYPFYYQKSAPGEKLKPQEVLEEVGAFMQAVQGVPISLPRCGFNFSTKLERQIKDMKENVIISTGVGQHQMWAAQFLRWRQPRSWVSSGGLGTMGYGLPAAIGAKVACPEKIVIDIDGDASFSMTGMELMTARQYNIGVKVLLLNNDFQGMVKQWQDLFYEQRYSGTQMTNPDFVKFAESMNCKGLRVSTREELPSVIAEFLATNEPVLLDAVVEKNEHVFPMMPAGKALHEMELGLLKLDEPRLHEWMGSA
ncbi:Acetolactate synthase, mitochondrial [Gonapodya sp. JEL0774]|nr:Acetolactate synthase, mitochondrial [Gonapodya sp. JEL0774]